MQFNSMMIWLIRSPLHFFVSKNMMVANFTGHKSGKAYSVPMNYLRDGEKLYTTSQRGRTWWRNLRNGNPVTLRLQGKDVHAIPQVTESDEGVADLLDHYFSLAPKMARYFEVRLDPEGHPIPEDVKTSAQSEVMITFRLAT